jgi:hypothetical protein
MAAALQKDGHFSKTQFPPFSQYEAWLGADLMIKGLQLAGPNPTSAKVTKQLRGIKSCNANGSLPTTIDYWSVFGHDLAECAWSMQAQRSGFVAVSPPPLCGQDVPATGTRSGSWEPASELKGGEVSTRIPP